MPNLASVFGHTCHCKPYNPHLMQVWHKKRPKRAKYRPYLLAEASQGIISASMAVFLLFLITCVSADKEDGAGNGIAYHVNERTISCKRRCMGTSSHANDSYSCSF